ncbi:hypothetical protein V8C37DRAFT_376685 [Trichoderma ceciliae]
MASYHRVLKNFGRSVDDKSLECDYDIHPWDILIDGERWAGKIRLVGFVDAFYLIRYSGESRFEHGLMIYKDDDCIRNTLKAAKITPQDIELKVINTKNSTKIQENRDENDVNGSEQSGNKTKKKPETYFDFHSEKGGLHYTITSLGHPIGLGTEYPKEALKPHTIKIRKGRDKVMKKYIRRAVKQHSIVSLMHDVVRLGFISEAEIVGMALKNTLGGTTIEDTTGKVLSALTGTRSSNNLVLSSARE